MGIELPPDGDSSTNDSIFEGRRDLYEEYWLYVDAVRYIGPVLEQSKATEEDENRSPLARHYSHFYEKKEEYKEKCSGLPGTLPKYKEAFEEPKGDARKVPESELNDHGIELNEGDDPIWLHPEYELPEVWETDLQSLDEAGLKKVIEQLREENEDLREERNELQERLERISELLSDYIPVDKPTGAANEEVHSRDESHQIDIDALSADRLVECSCGKSGPVKSIRAHINGKKGHGDTEHAIIKARGGTRQKTTKEEDDSSSKGSIHICQKCGEEFDSKAARNGHKPHCDASTLGKSLRDSRSESTTAQVELEDIAEELGEIQEQSSEEGNIDLPPDEGLKNWNELLANRM